MRTLILLLLVIPLVVNGQTSGYPGGVSTQVRSGSFIYDFHTGPDGQFRTDTTTRIGGYPTTFYGVENNPSQTGSAASSSGYSQSSAPVMFRDAPPLFTVPR